MPRACVSISVCAFLFYNGHLNNVKKSFSCVLMHKWNRLREWQGRHGHTSNCYALEPPFVIHITKNVNGGKMWLKEKRKKSHKTQFGSKSDTLSWTSFPHASPYLLVEHTQEDWCVSAGQEILLLLKPPQWHQMIVQLGAWLLWQLALTERQLVILLYVSLKLFLWGCMETVFRHCLMQFLSHIYGSFKSTDFEKVHNSIIGKIYSSSILHVVDKAHVILMNFLQVRIDIKMWHFIAKCNCVIIKNWSIDNTGT